MKTLHNLLKRARQWDEVALAQVYDTYAPAIYRYVYWRTGHPDTSQEIVAETFHRFLVALKQGGGPTANLSAWLYRVAHNLIVDFYRRQPEHALEMSEDNISVDPNDSETHLERQMQVAQAYAALQQLTPLQQQIIVLRFLEEMSLEEVAHVVNRTVGAVKALQHRAINSLRRILEEQDET